MKNIYLAVAAGLLAASQAQAQEALVRQNTPAAYELYRERSLWMNSPNPAGAMLDMPIDYASLAAGYRWYKGDYRLPQHGGRDNHLDIDVEGASLLRNLYAWGSFTHDRNDVYDAMYNASIMDPSRGMPYYYADLDPSEWRNQTYDMRFRLSSMRLFNALYAGLDGRYMVASAAKQRDMRTNDRSMRLEARPGLVFSPRKTFGIGASFEYVSYREQSSLEKVNPEIGQIFYEMFGLGTSYQLSTGTPTTDYKGNGVGGGAQLFWNGCVRALLEAGYTYYVEDAFRGLTNPENKLTIRRNEWRGALSLHTSPEAAFTHSVRASYLWRATDGIQFVLQPPAPPADFNYHVLYSSVRSTYNLRQLALGYSLTENRGTEYDLKAEAEIRYSDLFDHYILPASVFRARNLSATLGLKKNFALGERFSDRLLVGIDLTWNSLFSGEYSYGGPNPDYPVVTDLMAGNLAYATSDYMHSRLSATYSRKINPDSRANLFAGATLGFISASGSTLDHRQLIQVKVGCNF